MLSPHLLELCADIDASSAHLQGIQRLRQAMNEAIAARDWRTIVRLDRLCGQTLERLSGQKNFPDYLEELLAVRGLYARLILEVNQQLRRSLQHKS